MKKLLLTSTLILFSFITLFGQSKDSIRKKEKTLIILDHQVESSNPLYIIRIDDKKIEYQLNSRAFKDTFLDEIKPEWLEFTDVLKSEEGLEKYGSRAKDGVILVILRKDSWGKMTQNLQKRFK